MPDGMGNEYIGSILKSEREIQKHKNKIIADLCRILFYLIFKFY